MVFTAVESTHASWHVGVATKQLSKVTKAGFTHDAKLDGSADVRRVSLSEAERAPDNWFPIRREATEPPAYRAASDSADAAGSSHGVVPAGRGAGGAGGGFCHGCCAATRNSQKYSPQQVKRVVTHCSCLEIVYYIITIIFTTSPAKSYSYSSHENPTFLLHRLYAYGRRA